MDDLIAKLEATASHMDHGIEAAVVYEAATALRASAERERELREVLEPFIAVDALHRPTDLIRPVIADIQPMTVTVTKGQMRAARSILNKHKETANGGQVREIRQPRVIDTRNPPICEECDIEMCRHTAPDTGRDGWSCMGCGWSDDD